MENDTNGEYTDWISAAGGRFTVILSCLLSLLFFMLPLVPDIKILRPKLVLLETGIAGIAGLWLINAFVKGQLFLRRIEIAAPLFCYFAAALLFYFFSPDRPVAAAELTRVMLAVASFLAVAHGTVTSRGRLLVIGGLLAGAGLASLYGILQYYGGFMNIVVPHQTRIASTFGNPIFFAAYLVIMLPLALGTFCQIRNLFGRCGIGLVIAGCGYALFLTRTRAAYIGCFVAIAVFMLMSLRSSRAKIVSLFLLLAAAAGVAFAARDIWGREQAHLLIWRDALNMWLASPWSGTGAGTFHLYFPNFASAELMRLWPQGKCIVNDAHSEFLQQLTETGVIGLGLFLWLLITFFRSAAGTAAHAGARERFFVNGCIASCAGILTQNLFSADMRFTISFVLLFMVMGLVAAGVEEGTLLKNLPPLARIAGVAAVAGAAFVVFPQAVQPYYAYKHVAALPDFFDERVLEPAKTIAELEAMAVRYPGQVAVVEKLAWVYAKEKKWPQAIRYFEEAHRLSPDRAGPLNNLGNIYFLLDNNVKAVEYWRRSLAINPRQTDARLNLATAFYYQGRLREAAEELREALRFDPGNEKAIVMLKQMNE